MAICPECRASYGDDVETCPKHACALVPDDLFLAAEPTLAEGTMIGEYRIQKKLGAGTFGDVYAGEQPLIGKRVAVKVLNRRFASDPVMVSRFVAEARAVNKIRQRNIIDIFSFGVLPSQESHYFVMELLDGLTLGALMDKRGRLPFPVIVPIIRGIADALDAVHEAGITHRDLKPDNVFLALERDGSYFPKLLDFGIAKLVGDDVAHKTGPGMVLGTPRYMSPEQARGKPADHRSDIYALGVMIHEMLTGAPLFSGETAMDVLLKQATDLPGRMSDACAEVRPALDAPVLAMLEKRPKDRPASAGRAVAALIAIAKKLGIDRAGPTSLPAPSLSPGAFGRRAEAPSGQSTVAEGAPEDCEDAPASEAVTADPPRSGQQGGVTTGGRRTPSAAESGSAATLLEGSGSEPASLSQRSGPPTEGLSPVETSSGITALDSSLRWKLAAGVAGLVAMGLTLRMIGNPGPDHVSSAPVVAADAGAPTAAIPLPLAPPVVSAEGATAKPTISPLDAVEVHLTTHPADVEVWLGDRKLGTSSAALTLPRAGDRVELRLKKPGFKDETITLTPDRNQALEATLSPVPVSLPSRDPKATGKPATSAGKLDKLLGDR